MKLNNKLIRIFYEKISDYKSIDLPISEILIPDLKLNQEELKEYKSLDMFSKTIYPYQQYFDEETQNFYYYNPFNQETVWELPDNILKKIKLLINLINEFKEIKEKNISNYLSKSTLIAPYSINKYKNTYAMKQIDEPLCKQYSYRQNDEEYNIWYNKFLTDEMIKDKAAALTRCDPSLHVGVTKADSHNFAYYCVHFAKGCCAKGKDCTYLHRIPEIEDCLKIDNGKDIFGRNRYSTFRKDKSGQGNFLKEIRTLKISDFFINQEENIAVYYEIFYRHFSMFGQIEDIFILNTKGICYIRFKHRCMAEFVKEAMSNQSLENDEIITITWPESDDITLDKVDARDIVENKIKNKKIKKGETKDKINISNTEIEKDILKLLKFQKDPTQILMQAEHNLMEQKREIAQRNKLKLQESLKLVKRDNNSLFNSYN